ncbi:MAG: CaiB/BaiF CoA-transferase family protein, partial [Pseudomonadota bacterium]
LDLKAERDRAVAARMIARADVFVQNLAHGAAARLGFGAAALRQRHTKLICCDVSGFGPTGPYAGRKAYDLLIQAESGVVSVSGGPGEMGRVGVSIADIGAGLNAFGAISSALVRQARTGLGAHVEVSLFDTLAEWMTVPLAHHDHGAGAPGRVGLAHPSIAPYGAFGTADGRLILISVQSDREWRALARDVIDAPALAEDARFAVNTARVENRSETDLAVARAFASMEGADAIGRLDAARIAWGEVNDVAGLSAHPHLRRFDVAHEAGAASLPATAAASDWAGAGRVPALDEHGPSIRAEFGGAS